MLTAAELAAHFRTSERTVARLVKDGCPSLLVRGRRVYDLARVTTWLEERDRCQQEKTPRADGTQKHASAVAEFTAACRKVQLRVMPNASRQS